jgi:tetratricopeptide (TPR) repeat protein
MKKLLLTLLPSFLFSCIWIDGTTIDGEYKLLGYGYSSILKQTIEKESPQKKLQYLLDETHLKNKISKEDDAVILMLKGNYESAIKILLELNKKNPKKYSIASNLGTAYELNGENGKALKWISEGIKRDSNAHYGTEWLHQLILKIKIKLKREPNLLQTQRVITLPKEFNSESNISIDGKQHSIHEIIHALKYQLQERLIFVKPTEPIVADLFFTYAQIEAKTETLEEALAYLELAELYNFSDPNLLKETKSFYQNIIEHPSLSYHVKSLQNPDHIGESLIKVIFFVIIMILVVLLKKVIFYLYQKLIKREK